MEKSKKMNKFIKIFPWFSGLSKDLLFWVAINTLFLTVVKKLTISQIVSLTPISLIVCIVLQIPLLKIIKKIGNTNAVRVGAFLLLLSSILLTFGNCYIVILIGKITYEIAFTFKNMANAVLENNLRLQDSDQDFITLSTKANTIYAIVTMLISLVASIIFNINHYLPMLGCIFFCLLCFILSFFMVDFSKEKSPSQKIRTRAIKYSGIILLIILSYGLFYPIVASGQLNGQLFIQQELLDNYKVDIAALIIGVILFISRVIRVISNVLFNRTNKKYQDKIGIIFPCLLFSALFLMIVGSFISSSIVSKILVMSFGLIILLFIRDPFEVYIQNLLLSHSLKAEQQTLLTILDLAKKIIRAIIDLSFAVILIGHQLLSVMIILLALSFVEIVVGFILYRYLMKDKLKATVSEY